MWWTIIIMIMTGLNFIVLYMTMKLRETISNTVKDSIESNDKLISELKEYRQNAKNSL